MATSSIFADFTIKDPKTAEAFVMAIEESAALERQESFTQDRASLLTDVKAIQKLMKKRNVRK